MPDEAPNPTDIVLEQLTAASWPVVRGDDSVLLLNGDQKLTILEKRRRQWILNLLYLDNEDHTYHPQSGISQVRFPEDLSISDVVYFRRSGNCKLSIGPLQGILRDKYGVIETLEVRSSGNATSYSNSGHILKMSSDFYGSVLNDVRGVLERGKTYRGSVQRYLFNQIGLNRFQKQTQQVTMIQKGEFNFLVHRLNVETKHNKQDFDRYLDNDDIASLERLFTGMLSKDVFSAGYIRTLDDYFIKEKLTEIIDLGRAILALRSTDLSTDAARDVIGRMGLARRPRQFETLWQRYFEKNLLYLIFSYREIFPKVKLRLDGDKKFPDFLGINHYYGVDAIEIKHHLLPALVWDNSHKNFSFSPALSKAIIQTMNYMDAIKQDRFRSPQDRTKITETTNSENLYRPRGVIIISSWDRLATDRAILGREREKAMRDFTKLRNSLHSIEILTFDEVIDTARNYAGHFINSNGPGQ